MARATLTAAGRADYLAELDRAAEEAAGAAGGWEERWYRVAGETVLVRYAGAALAVEIGRLLSPAEVQPCKDAALAIHAWQRDPGRREGAARDYFEHGFVEWGEGALSALDAERGTGWFCVPSPRADEIVAPLSEILSAWLPARGVILVHGAAVGTSDGCVMLVGTGGRGKSTAAAACAGAGLGLIGDDTLLLDAGAPPQVLPLYAPTQLSGAPLRAIAIPRVTGERTTRAKPASAAAALAAVAPTSILRLPVPRELMFRRLAEVAGSVPCFELEAGTDHAGLAAAVAGLL